MRVGGVLALGVCNACVGIGGEFEVVREGCWRNFSIYLLMPLKDPCRISDFPYWDDGSEIVP